MKAECYRCMQSRRRRHADNVRVLPSHCADNCEVTTRSLHTGHHPTRLYHCLARTGYQASLRCT